MDFDGSKTIDEIDVFTLQDNAGSPSEPTETMTFSQYGATAFEVTVLERKRVGHGDEWQSDGQ
ncbi:MAG TPA: hypothetical protein DC047_18660 [Blastocatellia bacterium]|nr:hypothetical protein [Blastocatellia bacterium]